MKKITILLLLIAATFNTAFSQSNALTILQNVDNVLSAPKDQELMVKLTIVDRRGNESIRELTMLQKGSDKRMVKFLSPADQKGIAFLSLPNDNLTMYMPAFGRTRKVAGHVKNTKFAGTDYTYEDMEAKKYVETYSPKILKEDNTSYTLELTPKQDIRSEYAKLIITVRKSDNYPTLVEYYDRRDNFIKRMTSTNIRKQGNYLLAHKTVMEDLRSNTKSVMEVTQAKFDNNLSDEVFSERFLTR